MGFLKSKWEEFRESFKAGPVKPILVDVPPNRIQPEEEAEKQNRRELKMIALREKLAAEAQQRQHERQLAEMERQLATTFQQVALGSPTYRYSSVNYPLVNYPSVNYPSTHYQHQMMQSPLGEITVDHSRDYPTVEEAEKRKAEKKAERKAQRNKENFRKLLGES